MSDPAKTEIDVDAVASFRRPLRLADWDDLLDRVPYGARAAGIELVIVRFGPAHSVFSGRCQHRGALLVDGRVVGDDLVCGLHGWDYRVDTGVSSYDDHQHLHRFDSVVHDDAIWIDEVEAEAFARRHALRISSAMDEYHFHDSNPHEIPEEPHVSEIHELARSGLTKVGHHGPVAAMGVSREQLPKWDSLQFATAQLARFPLLDDEPVLTATVIGGRARRPLMLDIPVFVSDMSFGAISQEAKVALARGAQLAGTAVCSGEGGMLPEECTENRRYLYELASGRFGWRESILDEVPH